MEEGEEKMFRAVKVGDVHRIDSTKDKLQVFRGDLLKIKSFTFPKPWSAFYRL